MSFLAKKLKHRIHILKPVQTPSLDGFSFNIDYSALVPCWAKIEDYSSRSRYVKAIAGESTENLETHIFTIRRISVKYLGSSFTEAFRIDYDSIRDANPIKTEYFIYKEDFTSLEAEMGVAYGDAFSIERTAGRLFRVLGTVQDEDYKEFLQIFVKEIEERGTGYPE